jgi:predicted Zn-dependent peptidase
MAAAIARQDSLFYVHTLPNGFQMIGEHMPDVQSAAVIFWVRTGTRDENPKQMGVSHFLEHMAFRRTPAMTGREIDRTFEEMGADHNAGTWKEMTFYWARVLGENVPRAIDVLSQLTQPLLEAEDFNQERNVILEEIARYEDQPSHVLMSHFLQGFFGDHPLAWETLGTPETIKDLTVEEMREYWHRRYGTENMIFAIAGNFDWELVLQQVEALSKDWARGERGRHLSRAEFRPGLDVLERDKFHQEQIAIGVPSVGSDDPRYYAAAVLSTILGDDSGSRLFWSLYQTGLADSATAQTFEFDDNGVMMVHISMEPSKAQQALQIALEEVKRLQDGAVQQDELDRAKAKLNSSVIIGGESTNERVMGLINSWLTRNRLETLDEIRQKIEAVRIDDIRELLQAYPVWPEQRITAAGPVPRADLEALVT